MIIINNIYFNWSNKNQLSFFSSFGAQLYLLKVIFTDDQLCVAYAITKNNYIDNTHAYHVTKYIKRVNTLSGWRYISM